MSIPRRRACAASIMPGRLWIPLGPRTKSTQGAFEKIRSASIWATHPHTPITGGSARPFRPRMRPSSEKTFSLAFSRTAQVLSRRRSALSGPSAFS